jgi:putative RNA 2'-phosphotransferase
MDDVRASKFLALVLRHHPERIGLTLDAAGWTDVSALLAALASSGRSIPRAQLERVVADSDKQRFAIDATSDRICANQGHSVTVDLALAPATPPDWLFHGTPVRNLEAIRREGLRRGQRHAVHLSPDVDTAHKVGARRGAHVVLQVDAGAMHRDGHVFTLSANGVWLVHTVPPTYVTSLCQN